MENKTDKLLKFFLLLLAGSLVFEINLRFLLWATSIDFFDTAMSFICAHRIFCLSTAYFSILTIILVVWGDSVYYIKKLSKEMPDKLLEGAGNINVFGIDLLKTSLCQR